MHQRQRGVVRCAPSSSSGRWPMGMRHILPLFPHCPQLQRPQQQLSQAYQGKHKLHPKWGLVEKYRLRVLI